MTNKDSFDLLRKRLEGIAAMLGLPCAWKLTGTFLIGDARLPEALGRHQNAFCEAVKCRAGGEERCIINDSKIISCRLKTEHEPFIQHCHAGVSELVIPICADFSQALGALFIGPILQEGCDDSQACQVAVPEGAWRPPLVANARIEAIADFVPELMRAMLLEIYREPTQILRDYPQDERIQMVLELLQGNALMSIPALCQRTSLSRSRLLHLFTVECGISLGRYSLALRLNAASRYLLMESWPIVEIALETGFADQSHFTALFKEAFGITPACYRKATPQRREEGRKHMVAYFRGFDTKTGEQMA